MNDKEIAATTNPVSPRHLAAEGIAARHAKMGETTTRYGQHRAYGLLPNSKLKDLHKDLVAAGYVHRKENHREGPYHGFVKGHTQVHVSKDMGAGAKTKGHLGIQVHTQGDRKMQEANVVVENGLRILPVVAGLEEVNPETLRALNQCFDATFKAYFAAHSAHWNVVGLNFHQAHSLFKETYSVLFDQVDVIAEQLRQLRMRAPNQAATYISLGDCSYAALAAQVLDKLYRAYDATKEAYTACEQNGHVGTANILQGLCSAQQELGWKMRSTVTPDGADATTPLSAAPETASTESGPAFGKDWKAHLAITDIKHHDAQAKKHAAAEPFSKGAKKKQHAKWKEFHEMAAETLRHASMKKMKDLSSLLADAPEQQKDCP